MLNSWTWGGCILLNRSILLVAYLVFLIGPASAQTKPNLDTALLEIEDIQLGQQRKIRLKIDGESRCNFADMDAISFEMERIHDMSSKDPMTDVYLNIEPLIKSDKDEAFAPIVKCVSCGDVNNKHGGTFRLPQVEEPVLAGVFVCTASSIDGKKIACRDKDVANFGALAKAYSVKVDPVSGKAQVRRSAAIPSEKVFFFRYLIIEKDAVYYSPVGMTEQSYDALAKAFSKGRKQFGAARLAVKKFGSLASAPLKKKGNSLVVNLPHYDHTKCGH